MEISRQLALLLEQGVDRTGQSSRLSQIAEATGLRYQTLANLIQGKSRNPRLDTLLALCNHYGISLDYFGCEDEACCRRYLRSQRLQQASGLICDIERESMQISAQGRRNVLAIMNWMQAAEDQP